MSIKGNEPMRLEEERFTGFKRLVRKLTLHATPKMIAEAEKGIDEGSSN